MKDIKGTAKLVFEQFLMITVGVLLGTSILFLIDGQEVIPVYYPFEIIFIGFVTSLLSFMYYFKKEPTKKQFIIRVIIHFILLVIVVIGLGAMLNFYDSFEGALIVFVVILFVYAFVWIASAIINKKTSDEINEALKKFNE